MFGLAPLARAVLTGTLAGMAVGLVDGVRSAFPFAAGVAGAFSTVVLAIGVDGVWGGLGGLLLGGLRGVRAWGRRGSTPGWPAAVGWLLAGALSGVLGGAAVVATAVRVNRLLAACVAVAALLLGWAVAFAAGPALGRLLRRRRSSSEDSVASESHAGTAGGYVGRWLTAPAVIVLCSVAALVIVWRTRAPLRGAALWERGGWVFAIGTVAPWLVARAARWPRQSRVAPNLVRALALGVGAASAVALLAWRWQNDFQYLPWADLLVALAILCTGVGLWRTSLGTKRGLAPAALLAFALWSASAFLTITGASSEAARKALAARGGLVGPTLTVAMKSADRDGDGHSRWLGGGDCNDADADINPGALDWPQDGIDQDCDGHDATWASVRSPPFHSVPDGVPPDLNVLLIAVDTLRADHLGAYGYERPTSTNIDALARDAVVFENGWAHAPSTRYSMPAIVTGRWPSAISWEGGGTCQECRSWWPRFSPSNRTIGQVLKEAGYFTGALWAYSYFDADERRGFERGIDVYDSRRAALHTNVAGPAESVGTSSAQITDDALAFLSQHGEQKFFLTVHYYDPHMSYERHENAPAFGTQPVDLYDGEVWFTDQHIGRLLRELKARGLWEKTAVVLTGDHGEGFGEYGIVAHGYHLYPAQTKVPFIVRVPGVAPRRETLPVSHVDVAPTIANLARVPHEASFLGRSFVDLLLGNVNPEVPVPPVFQEVSYEGDNKKRGIVTKTHQLIWNWTPHNTTECYAHEAPTRDLWGTPAGADVCPPMKAELRRWLALLALPADVQEKMAHGVFAADAHAPAPTISVDARLGESLQVLGVDAPGHVARGQAIEVSFHFKVIQPVEEGWKLFFHLNGPGGVFINLDHAPVGGAYPVDRWRAAQTIIDRHSFTLPVTAPPGLYQLSMGLWRGAERMPVDPPSRADGEKRLRLFQLQVD